MTKRLCLQLLLFFFRSFGEGREAFSLSAVANLMQAFANLCARPGGEAEGKRRIQFRFHEA